MSLVSSTFYQTPQWRATISNANADVVITGAQLAQGFVMDSAITADRTLTLPTVAQFITALGDRLPPPGNRNGWIVDVDIMINNRSAGDFDITLTTAAGFTIRGGAVVGQDNTSTYKIVFTGDATANVY